MTTHGSRLPARAALGTLVALGAFHAWWRAFLIDDAYISFRYARNLALGRGLVFNLGERTEGYTNFLWTLFAAAAIRLGLDPGVACQGLGIACAVATLLVVHRFGRDLGAGRWGALLAPAMLAVNRSFAAWATSGLETRLFTLLVIAAAWRLHAERRRLDEARAVFPFSGILIAAACLTRPEGYLALAVAGAGVAIASLRKGGGRPYPLGWAAAAVAIPLAHLLWRHDYYGDWVPNSFHAKVPGLRLESGWIYLRAFAGAHLGPAAAALIAWPLARWLGARRGSASDSDAGTSLVPLSAFSLPFAALYLVYTWAIGGDHFEFRFVDAPLVIAYLASALAILEASRLTGWPVRARGGLAAAALLLAGWSSLAPFRGQDTRVGTAGEETYVSITSVETEAEYLRRWAKIGRGLHEHAAPDESIAV
ncbi:MAG: hypothetical protein HY049_19580, partial [Acidobacteria bacterium]|nr:hypothetical protein [Acidobacteriota bacterium]